MLFAVPQTALAITYQNVTDVFYDFSWDWIKLQVRSCQQSDCSDGSWTGPDNTSATWFIYPNNTAMGRVVLTDTNISVNRYFQYKTYLWTDNNTKTPKLFNVSLGYFNETYISSVSISPSSPYSSAQLICSAEGYNPAGEDFNLTFRWYNNSVLFNETNISSANNLAKSFSASQGVQKFGETWNCTVRVYKNSTIFSNWSSATAAIVDSTYAGTDDVFYDFMQMYNISVKLQVRSCQQSDCSDGSWTGPDNTSGTWFTNSSFGGLSGTNIADSRYFQWKAFFITSDASKTPKFYNITLYLNRSGSAVTINFAFHIGPEFADDSMQGDATYGCVQDSSGWFGLTMESPLGAQRGNLSGDYNINVSGLSSDKFYIAAGTGGCANFRRYAAEAQLKRFLSPLIAFSYAKTSLIQLILPFNNADIVSDSHWGKGTYLLSVRNDGYNSSSGKQNLGIRVVK